MANRVMRALIALVIALATTLPVGTHAMPMPSALNGMAADQTCPSCPHPQAGDMNPGNMPACQILACAGPMAMLPAPVLAHRQAFLRVAYVKVPPARWTEAGPAPEPFPPRPIVLL
jgi:hypothetical protein